MKDLKRNIKIACIAFITLLNYNSVNAQVMVSNGGTYNVCEGSATIFEVTPASGYIVAAYNAWQFGSSGNTCSTPPCTYDDYTVNSFTTVTVAACSGYPSVDEVNITANTLASITITVIPENCSGNGGTPITFTIVPYSTSISGTASFCESSNETYTCTTNIPGTVSGDYAWTVPSFLSGTSTSNTDATTTTGYGTGNVSVVVNSASGCLTSSLSSIASLPITSYSSATLGAPGDALVYVQFNGTCYFNGNVGAVPNAEYYEWSKNSSFTSAYGPNTTTPTSYGGPFYEGTYYTVYVRCTNECGISPHYATYTKETPRITNCEQVVVHRPIQPSGEEVVPADFKIYPTPANDILNIEYPTLLDNSTDITCEVYDILGHKIASWILPSSENKVNEDISTLQPGLYVYRISSGTNVLLRGKLMIQR